jgi:hypothetical protein
LLALALLAGCSRPGPAPTPPPARGPAPPDFAALDRDPAQCRAALERLGVRATIMPPRTGPQGCGYPWAVQRATVPAGHPRWLGEPPATSCAVAAALTMWERDVLQPAARRHLGEPVSAIRHFGSYGCRPINNRAGARLSEHARANAIDIAGFQLASGRSVTVKEGWNGTPAEQAFLREIRTGACRSFGTVLSPDYDAPHADHLHLDQMRRPQPFCR